MDRLSTASDASFSWSLCLMVAAALLGGLVGCDTVSTRTSVSEEPARADGEVVIEDKEFTRADLQFDPVGLTKGETFSIELVDDDHDQNVTRITHEGTEEGRHLIRAQFDPLDPASVTVKCRNQNSGSERKMATLGGAQLQSKSLSQTPMAKGGPEPTSYHYIDSGETVIVEVDYGGASGPGGQFSFPSADQPVECTHVAFVLEDVSTSISADGIRFQGLDQAPTFRHRQFR